MKRTLSGLEKENFIFGIPNLEIGRIFRTSPGAYSIIMRGQLLNMYFSTLVSPPAYWALGAHTVNALPEGYVEKKGEDQYDICINKAYYFINDSFNFEGSAYLGSWFLSEAIDMPNGNCPRTAVTNGDFREFQRHGYGGYFPVLSKLQEVENFEPVCWKYRLAK